MTTFPILVLCSALSVSACADMGSNYEPILDGPSTATYTSDKSACQTLARTQQHLNQETLGAAVVGGALGAAVADHDGEAAVAGLAIGALFGYFGGVFEAKDKREDIIIECLRGRGHLVVG